MIDWMLGHRAVLGSIAALSAVLFIAGVVAVPILVVRMPADYFVADRAAARLRGRRHPVVRAGLVVARTVLGALLIAAGLLMLFLPGQGILAILAGIALLDIPGNHRLARAIASQSVVRRWIDALRHRAGRQPLLLDR